MKLLDWIFKRDELSKKERENLELTAKKIEVKLGQPFSFNSLRRIVYSKDNVIAITPRNRHLFHESKMVEIKKKDLLFQSATIGDARNIFPKRHFNAVTGAFGWKYPILMGKKGKAPALFKTEKANIWIAPIIPEE